MHTCQMDGGTFTNLKKLWAANINATTQNAICDAIYCSPCVVGYDEIGFERKDKVYLHDTVWLMTFKLF